MLEKYKKYDGRGKVFDLLLPNLWKAFDCLDHKLFTTKLNALPALCLIHYYLSNRKIRLNTKNINSTWMETISGVPQD